MAEDGDSSDCVETDGGSPGGSDRTSDGDRSESDDAGQFTSGPLLGPVLGLAWPLVAIELLQVAYNVTDTFWVGRLGPDGVQAISFSWPIVAIILALGGGISVAGTILVAQHSGAGAQRQADHIAGQTMAFATALAGVLSLVGFAFTPELLQLIGSEPGTEFHGMAIGYTRVIFLGMVFTYGMFMFNGLLRGWGDTRTPMYLMIGSVGLNLIADPFFILGFDGNDLFAWFGLQGLEASLYAATGFGGWGVTGAAVATVLCRGLAAGVGFWLLVSGRVGLAPELGDFVPQRETVGQLVRVGAPASVESFARSGNLFVMTALAATVSPVVVGAFGVGHRFTTLASRPAIAMGMATDTVVGQNVGDQKAERARRAVVLCGAMVGVWLIVLGSVVAFFADPIAAVFVEDGQDVVDATADFLRVIAPLYAFMGVYHVFNGAFHGSGSTDLSMKLGITCFWGVQSAACAVMVLWLDMGATGVWYAVGLSYVTAFLGFGGVYLTDVWTDSVIGEPESEATPAD